MTFLATKVLRALLSLFLCLMIVFVALRASGDVATILLPEDASAEAIEAMRARWGLDRPIWEQFLRYIGNLLQGDFGMSMRNGWPVADLIAARIPKTLVLGTSALIFALMIGIPLGIVAALYHGGPTDRAVIAGAVVGYSLPNMFLGILLILIFAMQLRLLPSSGSDSLGHLILPAITLGTSIAGIVARFTRAAMLDNLQQPYMRATLARGLPWRHAVLREAFPNAAIPVLTVLGFIVGGLIGGAVVTETLFAWPGLGQLLVIAVAARDLPVVQAIILLTALSMVTTNLTVDLLYGVLDPRVRHGVRGSGLP